MITALVSAILGGITGLLPDVFKFVKDRSEHKMEIERLNLQADLQLKMLKAGTDARIREIDAGLATEEVRAMAKQMQAIQASQARVTGIAWVDGFNSLLRPTTALMVMVLFFATAAVYIYGTMEMLLTGAIGMTDVATLVWGSLIGEAIQAVLGFLFGYRGTAGRLRG